MTRTEIIKLLIEKYGYKKYLEIGVNTPAQPGFNFTSIETPIKHGVDPAVDTTFKMTSDVFFEDHIPMKYDIVFVDGLHVFDQAYRDIVNSLTWLEDNGSIVVHDTNPTTEITQRPERASNVWHGDVWKAILKLRTEHPDIEIYTIDADEGCAIIKKGTQKLFQIPEGVDGYTFDFFDKNRKEILNLITPKEFGEKIGVSIKNQSPIKKAIKKLRDYLAK